VGQAQNASTALTLVRNLRPDVAIIDCYLPYSRGLDTVPLSRIGGLDIAQTISEELPNMKVILLNNLNTEISTESSLHSGIDSTYSIDSQGANIPLMLQDPRHEAVQSNALVFASIEAKPRAPLSQRTASLSDKAIFFGGLGIGVGWILTITIIFAPAGVPLAIAGGAILVLGLTGKLTPSWWRRLLRKRTKP
jgi:CheY-like chemotaxis protein